jgi:hypothetical protein
MAQPTIYADIDCDGQVEVKVNNDTGYDCTIITSTGINETISSTATDVYRNYNLTSADWVKVVAAQDVTIAANKLTGTIKYITSVTTTTAAPTTTTAAPTTTTTTTPAGGATPISGGVDCANALNWPAYGSSNKYAITISDSTTEQWFNITSWSTRTIFITIASGKLTKISDDSDISNGDTPCMVQGNTVTLAATWNAGVTLPSTQTGNFGIKGGLGGSTGTFDIWVV